MKVQLDIAEQVAPEAEEWREFRQILRFAQEVDDLNLDSEFDKELPSLHHPELEILYHQGLDIVPEELAALLQLPRETLIEDLKIILQNSIERFDYFETVARSHGWDEETFYFPFHALFLLAELKATEQLPAVINTFRQGHDYLEFWFGDHTFETLWMVVYQLGEDQLDLLAEYMRERTPDNDFKAIISTAVQQLYLHQPERREEIFHWFRDLLQYFMDHREDEQLADPEVISSLIFDAEVMDGAENLLPLIRSCYEHGLVDESDFGTYAELERDMREKRHFDRAKREVFTHTAELYRHLLETWYADPELDDPETPSLDELENKQPARPPYRPDNLPAAGKVTASKIGRNDPCPCGSGKKYKKCCWGK